MADGSNNQDPEVETTVAAEESLSLKETIAILLKSSRAFWQVNIVNFGDGIAYFGILTLQYMERCYSAAVFTRYEWFQGVNPLNIKFDRNVPEAPCIASRTLLQ